jgi:hypothetical protein
MQAFPAAGVENKKANASPMRDYLLLDPSTWAVARQKMCKVANLSTMNFTERLHTLPLFRAAWLDKRFLSIPKPRFSESLGAYCGL